MRTTLVLTILVLCVFCPVQAQDKVEGSLQADFVSSYVWRGLRLGHVGVQPELSVGWKGLSLSAWGNVPFSKREDDCYEIDLTLSYETGGLTLGIVDYWDDSGDPRFFYYKKDDTGHSFEGFVAYDFGPLSASWQTIFAGYDWQAQGESTFW